MDGISVIKFHIVHGGAQPDFTLSLCLHDQTAGDFKPVPPSAFFLFIELSEEPAACMEVFIQNQHFLSFLQYFCGTQTGRSRTDDDRIKHGCHLLSPDVAVLSAVCHSCLSSLVSGMLSDSFLH